MYGLMNIIEMVEFHVIITLRDMKGELSCGVQVAGVPEFLSCWARWARWVQSELWGPILFLLRLRGRWMNQRDVKVIYGAHTRGNVSEEGKGKRVWVQLIFGLENPGWCVWWSLGGPPYILLGVSGTRDSWVVLLEFPLLGTARPGGPVHLVLNLWIVRF